MNYQDLERKKVLLEQLKPAVPEERIERMEQEFEEEFIFHSMALSGGTLTREEVKAVLAAMCEKETAEKEMKQP